MTPPNFQAMHRMPAIWNAINGRRWAAAHDLLNELQPQSLGKILPFKEPKIGKD